MRKKKEKIKSVRSYFLNNMLLIAIVSIIGSGYFWISAEYSNFQKESEQLQHDFIDNQKLIIQFEVNKVIDLLTYNQKQTEQRLQNNIKNRVYEAYRIAKNIYDENKKDKTKSQIEKMIKDALRPIRFNSNRGYYFAVSMTGIEKLYPVAPQFEGQNLLNLQDEKKNFVIQDEIRIAKEKGEGFVKDYWRKPESGNDMIYPKISFVKYFEPLNWYLGTGEYLDDVRNDIQLESLDRISKIRFGESGYIFVNKYNGDAIITDGAILNVKKNLWEVTDPNGNKVIQLERKAVNNLLGDFIYYSWIKMEGQIPEKKISFIRGFPDWEWMIGAGFYINDIEPEINSLRIRLGKRIRINILKILLVLLLLMIAIYTITRFNYNKIRRNFNIFLDFFHDAAHKSLTINMNKLNYQEFVSLAESANKMLETRIKTEKLLMESEEKYKMVVTNQGEGVVLFDLNKNFLFVNPAAEKIFEVSTDELIGRNLDEFIEEEYEHRKNHFETRIKTDKGNFRDLLVTSTPNENENSYKKGTLVIFRDITIRKKIERERDENREQLKLINKILRHDITNDLAVIKSALKIYKRTSDILMLTEIESKIKKALNTIKRLREQESFIESHSDLSEYSIAEVFQEVMSDIQGVDIHIEGDATAFADKGLYSVFENIITNAIKHGKSSKIEILISTQEQVCEIRIKDFGIGIPNEIKEKIFEEGFIYGETGHTGIGLHIVKQTIEGYGGQIYVEDNKPMGTTFVIRLINTNVKSVK